MTFALHQITVDVPDCPSVPANVAGIPSWVVGWGIAVTFLIVIAFIVSTAIVRYKHHEQITARQLSKERALIDAAKQAKNCPGCGMRYSIEDELNKVGP